MIAKLKQNYFVHKDTAYKNDLVVGEELTLILWLVEKFKVLIWIPNSEEKGQLDRLLFFPLHL